MESFVQNHSHEKNEFYLLVNKHSFLTCEYQKH